MKNVISKVLILIFLLSSFSVWSLENKEVLESIPAKDFAEKINSIENPDSFMIVDVRTPQEFKNGRIKGSVNIDIYSPDFITELEALDKEKPYFIYCRSGNRSGQALQIMGDMGFKEVYNLKYGIGSVQEYMDIVK